MAEAVEGGGIPPLETRRVLQNFFRVLFKRKRLAWGSALAMFGLIGLVTYYIDPQFETTTSIYVQLEKLPVAVFPDLAPPMPGLAAETGNNVLNTYVSMLMGRRMAERIVRRFNLDAERKILNPRDAMHVAVQNAITAFMEFLDRIGIIKYVPDPFRRAVDDLMDHVTAEVSENTEVLVLTVQYTKPKLTKKIAETMMTFFIEDTVATTRHDFEEVLKFTLEQLPKAEGNLQEAEQALRRYKQEAGVVQIDEQLKVMVSRLDELEQEIHAAQSSGLESSQRLAAVRGQLARQKMRVVSSSVIESNPMVRDLENTLYQQQRDLAALLTQDTEKHPDVLQARARLEQTQKDLRKQVRRILGSETEAFHPEYLALLDRAAGLEADVIGAATRTRGAQATLASFKGTIKVLPTKEQRLIDLQRQQSSAENIYLDMKKKASQLRVMVESKVPPLNFKAFDPPYLPKFKDIKMPPYIIIILLLPFMLVGTALMTIFFAEYWDNSFKTPEEAQHFLSLPVLTAVPPQRRAKRLRLQR